MDELPVCTRVLGRDRAHRQAPADATTAATGAPPLTGADAGRSGAKRVGGGPAGPSAVRAGGPVDTITLDSTARHRRRVRLESDGGTAFLLDLPSATLLRDGDLLVLPDRGTIEVRAAAEALHEIRGDGPGALLRLAWHIGNRHLPTEVRADHLRIRKDPVIRTMLEGLGATVTDVSAGFDPEGGAYAEGHAHSHAHPRADAPDDPAGTPGPP